MDETIHNFEEIKGIVMNKQYDYLDQRNLDFENDFKNFLGHIEELKESISEMIERNFDSVWETPQGIKFLTRFEKVNKFILLYILTGYYNNLI